MKQSNLKENYAAEEGTRVKETHKATLFWSQNYYLIMVYALAVVSDIRSRFSRRGPKIMKPRETVKDIYPRVYVDALVIIAKYIPPLCCMTMLPRCNNFSHPWESPSYTVIGKTTQPPPPYSVGVVWVPYQT